MRRVIYTALMAGGALVLAACGLADSRSPVPEFMRGGMRAASRNLAALFALLRR